MGVCRGSAGYSARHSAPTIRANDGGLGTDAPDVKPAKLLGAPERIRTSDLCLRRAILNVCAFLFQFAFIYNAMNYQYILSDDFCGSLRQSVNSG